MYCIHVKQGANRKLLTAAALMIMATRPINDARMQLQWKLGVQGPPNLLTVYANKIHSELKNVHEVATSMAHRYGPIYRGI
jgi:hypothetical protein